MTKENAILPSSFLQEMVKVKKIRFKESKERHHRSKVTHDFIQRKANFEEFKTVYEGSFNAKLNATLSKEGYLVRKTMSGMLYQFQHLKVKKEPQIVETVNIELPVNIKIIFVAASFYVIFVALLYLLYETDQYDQGVGKPLILLDELVNEMWKRIINNERPNYNNYQHKIILGAHTKAEQMNGKVEFSEFGKFNVKSSSLHYGADRAVQIIGNKIKPKRSSSIPKVNRESITHKFLNYRNPEERQKATNKPKKSVYIVDKLNTIEEMTHLEQESIAEITEKEINDIQKQLKGRKERIYRTLPKSTIYAKVKRKPNENQIMKALSHINEKLLTMQEKYFNNNKVQYKNVNNCFTQSGNVEILYANNTYPEEMYVSDADVKNNFQISNKVGDFKQNTKVDTRFPEFPKIEYTLREIENHLENIVNLEDTDNTFDVDNTGASKFKEIDNMWAEETNSEMCNKLDQEYPLQESITDEILKKQKQIKNQKMKLMRHQIDEAEEFCDRMSEMANIERIIKENESRCDSARTLEEDVENYTNFETKKGLYPTANKIATITKHIEGPDLHKTIKKSSYLSKEFNNLNKTNETPMIKIFSENKKSFWRDRLSEVRKQNEDCSVESITKMIDTLKFTLENSLYEPVA